jgi:hypothetical protein
MYLMGIKLRAKDITPEQKDTRLPQDLLAVLFLREGLGKVLADLLTKSRSGNRSTDDFPSCGGKQETDSNGWNAVRAPRLRFSKVWKGGVAAVTG